MIKSFKCAAIVALTLFSATGDARDRGVDGWLKETRGGNYRPVGAAEARRAEELFRDVLTGDGMNGAAAWMALGFELTPRILLGQRFLSLTEHPAARRGRGAFLFRTVEGHDLLQAPHRFFDRGTGTLAGLLFLEGGFRAAAWNTLHRRETDLARIAPSYFTALAAALAKTFDAERVIQLHGFSREKRRTEAGRTSDLILSPGHGHPNATLYHLDTCLGSDLPYTIRLYPLEVDELGGTRNPVGQLLRGLGSDRFLHLEMSAELRQGLRIFATQRTVLIRCLGIQSILPTSSSRARALDQPGTWDQTAWR